MEAEEGQLRKGRKKEAGDEKWEQSLMTHVWKCHMETYYFAS